MLARHSWPKVQMARKQGTAVFTTEMTYGATRDGRMQV